MNIKDITEDTLNLFIDEQLDSDEMNEIHKALLDDKALRERVCQLKAVRELIAYAYTEVPKSRCDGIQKSKSAVYGRAIAASVTLFFGVAIGWSTYQYIPDVAAIVATENTSEYMASYYDAAEKSQRKIILHIDSGDMQIVNAALNEADQLLTSYRKANSPMTLEVITNKSGINILRPEMSPYIARIQKMIDDGGVSFYACKQSINKANVKEGVEIVFMPGVKVDESAKDMIPERQENGWVYIKA